ncbi:hypothetical protein B0T19DRAFT_428536 [Cercophora scortea]|uniref:Secreted protein n=1 Tax=Cercophora scortea TaxID=314031 RepID=A0AAE0IFY9_9PEZI|nr:hypothetical protein B0T19DRAFT_428536 [Cercophora scortea]
MVISALSLVVAIAQYCYPPQSAGSPGDPGTLNSLVDMEAITNLAIRRCLAALCVRSVQSVQSFTAGPALPSGLISDRSR